MIRFVPILLVIFLLTLRVSAQESYLVAGTYNETHPNFVYTGSWNTSFGSPGRGGNHTSVFDDFDFMQFNCICDGFTIIHLKCDTCGLMSVFVDGYRIASFTTQGVSVTYGNQYVITGLESGFHSITIQKGASFPTPNTEPIAIEGVDISHSVTVPPTPNLNVEVTLEVVFPEQTPEPTPAWRDEHEVLDETGKPRTVAFDWKFTGDGLMVGTLLAGILFLTIIRFALDSFRGNS